MSYRLAVALLVTSTACTAGVTEPAAPADGDVLSPSVTSTLPASGAVAVAPNTVVSASFSEPMRAGTVTSALLVRHDAQPLAGNVAYDAELRRAVFTPSAALLANTLYTAVVTTAAQDLAGNHLAAEHAWTFTTGSAADATPPVISQPQPSGTLPSGTSQVMMSVSTNESATCKYDLASSTAYASMTSTFTTTGGTTHSTELTGLADDQSYAHFVRCQDSAGNVNEASTEIAFAISLEAGPIFPTLAASRTTGAAPLAVFFDLTGTTAPGLTNQPFHELEYRCDFGDAAGGATWGFGSRAGSASKNVSFGPVQAHLFESAGTFEVVCTVRDGTYAAQVGTTITVTSGFASTLCVAASAPPVAGAGGCPAGADVLQASDFDEVINTTAANGHAYKRVLFACGDAYTTSSFGWIEGDGPGLVGAYPEACPDRPHIVGPGGLLWWGNDDHAHNDFGDWRIVDLSFDGVDQLWDALRPVGPFTQVTILRVALSNANLGVHLPDQILAAMNDEQPGDVSIWSQLAVVDSVIEPVANYGLLGDIRQLAFLGNRVNDNNVASGHLVRTGYCSTCIFSHNELGPDSTGNRLTVRAFGSFAAGSSLYPPNTAWTENVIVSDNTILGTYFTIRAVNNYDDGRLRNIIVERNELVAVPTTAAMLTTEAGLLTIRNNIMTLSDTAQYNGVGLAKSTGTPEGIGINRYVSVYNNTFFASTSTSSQFIMTLIATGTPDDLTVKNNLSYLPNLTGPALAVGGTPGANAAISHNTEGAAVRTSPGFASQTPAAASDFRPSTAAAVDAGTQVPVWSDFFGEARAGAYDLGAVNP